MSPLVDEWIGKAEGDFIAAGRELRARKQPVYHVVCYLYINLLNPSEKSFAKKWD